MHNVVYAIILTNDTDGNNNNYFKLEIPNSSTRLMEELLVKIIIEKHLDPVSNNKTYVLHQLVRLITNVTKLRMQWYGIILKLDFGNN